MPFSHQAHLLEEATGATHAHARAHAPTAKHHLPNRRRNSALVNPVCAPHHQARNAQPIFSTVVDAKATRRCTHTGGILFLRLAIPTRLLSTTPGWFPLRTGLH